MFGNFNLPNWLITVISELSIIWIPRYQMEVQVDV